jgi:hypothetical protein
MTRYEVALPDVFTSIRSEPYKSLERWLSSRSYAEEIGCYELVRESVASDIALVLLPMFRSKEVLQIALEVLKTDKDIDNLGKICDLYLSVLQEMEIEVQ